MTATGPNEGRAQRGLDEKRNAPVLSCEGNGRTVSVTPVGGTKMSSVDPLDEFTANFFQRIGATLAATFTAEQLAAIRHAFGPSQQTVNIRATVPFTRGRYFFVLLFGRERRAPERAETERKRNPLWTGSNIVVLASFSILSLLAAVGVVAVVFGTR